MEHQDILLTYAEVAAAFAGFSAIVSSFAENRRSKNLRINHYRIKVMIEYSLCVVIFAFLPTLLVLFFEMEDAAWRLSSAVLIVVWGIIALLSATRARAVLGVWGFSVAAGFSYSMLVLTLLGITVLGLSVLGIHVRSPAGSYLIGLFFPLLQSAFYFLHIVTYSEPFDEE